ncbi:glycosyltransferase family 2 protein [Geotalea toluenoxydans]|uniref:glycosyltransferase family 2 protein n=1 Tax=Geotalea toluenoxydans TaxID=421624 RepID=UPI0006D06C38|nr:glycosyltransferase family 2 protein [Geotalea toluenoxydans]
MRLSICIPTYNRAVFLDELLASIASQVSIEHTPLLEVCVSDNASTDDTAAVVARWQSHLPVNLVYHKNSENLGADRNYLQAVAIASGDFCWLMGSDDRLEPGAIDVLLARIDDNSDLNVAILSRNYYDCSFGSLLPIRQPLRRAFTNDVRFSGARQAIDHITYELGYLSVLVFRRACWLQVAGHEEFIGSAYVHVYKLLAMIRDCSGAVMYLSRPLVGWRANNDSFLNELKYLAGSGSTFSAMTGLLHDSSAQAPQSIGASLTR